MYFAKVRTICGILISLISWNGFWSHAFNLAPEASLIYFGVEKNSYFGYSVGLLPENKLVVVGSPKSNSEYTPSVKRPGAVFKCSIQNPFKPCTEVLIDKRSNGFPYSWSTKGIRNESMLGMSLDTFSQGNIEDVLVCAPRFSTQQTISSTKIHMPGQCYTIKGNMKSRNVNILSLFQNIIGEGRDGSTESQVGLSVHYLNVEGNFILGAPGYELWDGACLQFENYIRQYTTFPKNKEVFAYFGMSVSSDEKGADIVAGAPGNDFGKVTGIRENGFKYERVSEHFGENFGGQVCQVDLNNDGLSDWIIGAPTYTDENGFVVGCIYVYMGTAFGMGSEPTRITGSKTSEARFGHTIMAVGDLDHDGYNDIAVGAPYENDRDGGIYIFRGNSKGLMTSYSQHITPEQIHNFVKFKGLGISMSKAYDIDGNGYNDFAVGSFLTEAVVILRSRPVINIKGSVSCNPSSINFNINKVILTSCHWYEGYNVPNAIDITESIVTDPNKKQKKAYFGPQTSISNNITIQKGSKICKNYEVTIEHQRNRKPSPIHIEMASELTYKKLPAYQLSTDVPKKGFYRISPLERPVSDPSDTNVFKSMISIEDGCQTNPGGLCNSDLVISGSFTNFTTATKGYVIGSSNNIRVRLSVSNLGQIAYLPTLTVSVKAPLDLHIPELYDCERFVNSSINSFICSWASAIGDSDSKIDIDFNVDVSKLNFDVELIIFAEIQSTSREMNPNDNSVRLTLPLITKASIDLKWSTHQEVIYYPRISDDKMNTTETITIVQNLLVIKRGPSPLGRTLIRINYPSHDRNCQPIVNINKTTGNDFECRILGKESSGQLDDYILGRAHRNTETLCTNKVLPENEKYRGLECLNDSNIFCSTLSCAINDFERNTEYASLSVHLEFNLTNLENEIYVSEGVSFTKFTQPMLEFNQQEKNVQVNLTSTEFRIDLLPSSIAIPLSVNWYWIVAAVLLAIVILMLMVLVMYKVGFFKRKRLDQKPLLAELKKQNCEEEADENNEKY